MAVVLGEVETSTTRHGFPTRSRLSASREPVDLISAAATAPSSSKHYRTVWISAGLVRVFLPDSDRVRLA
ncbi:hypothetical protein AZG88_25060 [Rhodococcus sp. LB1]|nr:hypothetical protein AZG88_25060 [Rhodococcus sp. LB1]